MESYVALTAVTAMLHAVGQALQKHGMATRLPRITLRRLVTRIDEFAAAMLKNRLWVAGLLLTIAGSITGFQALAMGDLTVVKPLIKLQTVFLVLIGVFVLRERMSHREWAGVATILIGAGLLAAVAGPSTDVVPGRTMNVAMVLFTFALTGFVFGAQRRWWGHVSAEFSLALGAGLLFGVGDLMIKASTGMVKRQIGSFSVLQAASVTAVVTKPELHMSILANVVGFAMMQTAFANGRVSLIAPLIGIGATVFPVLAGFFVFGEPPYPVRIAGITAMMIGTVMLLPQDAGAVALPAVAVARSGEGEAAEG